MSNKPHETVWMRNKIAPLEYCSLERASRLLGCEVDDLWHWQDIGMIKFAVNLGKEIPMTCGIFSPDERECSLLSEDEQRKLKTSVVMALGYNQRGFCFSFTDNEMHVADAINVHVICSGVFCFEKRIERVNPHNWHEKNFIRIEECDHGTVFIRGEISERDFLENELLITRDAIEDVFSAMKNGFFSTRDVAELPIRITVYQSDMIVSLLRLLDFSEDEIFNISADALNKKLGQMAARKGINISQPDKGTWSKWREKFR